MATPTPLAYHPDLEREESDRSQMPPVYNALVALERGRITDRDVSILKELARSQFLTRMQVQQLVFGGSISRSTIQKRLRALASFGLVTPIRWSLPDDESESYLAYGLTINGALLLRQYHGSTVSWKPGFGRRHLKPVLRILAANQFRAQMEAQRPGVIWQWRIHTRHDEPVASFRMGGEEQYRLFLVEAPRDEEDVWELSGSRYAAWEEKHPVVFIIAGSEDLAAQAFGQLKGDVTATQLLFSTDDRVLNAPVDDGHYVWQWGDDGRRISLSLV